MYDSPRILIIEDDKYIQSFISLSLKTNGYVFDRASTGIEGISLFNNNHPDIIFWELKRIAALFALSFSGNITSSAPFLKRNFS
jgi:two-component SAPR family response regulator